jgi:hypothetical protein
MPDSSGFERRQLRNSARRIAWCRVPPPFKHAMRAVRLAGERIAVGSGCSLDAWTIAVARFSRGSSAISPAFAHSPNTRDRMHSLPNVLRSLLTLKRQGERGPPLTFCGYTLEDWDNEFRHPAFEKPNHRRTRSLSFVSLVRNFSRQRFEQNRV